MSKISKSQSDEPSIQDVLTAINTFSTHVESTMATKDDLVAIDSRLTRVESTMATKADLASLEARMATKEDLAKLEARMASKDDLAKLEVKMVTKDYLDEKLFNLKGDLIVMLRKEDHKTTAIVELLNKKKVFTNTEAKSILRLEPFAK